MFSVCTQCLTYPFHFLDLGISAFPQGLKQERNISQTGGITFSWKEVDCEQRNGVLLGYEIKLYYDEQVCTGRVVQSITTFTIPPLRKPELCFPKAISVAAINEVGVGNHCPPVNVTLLGEREIEFACSKRPLIPYNYRAYEYRKIEVGTKVPPFLKSAHIYPRN